LAFFAIRFRVYVHSVGRVAIAAFLFIFIRFPYMAELCQIL